MPTHDRQLIREAAKTALLGPDAPTTHVTSAGARVYETRMVPWRRLELPAIAVYSLEESVEANDSAPRELTRTLQLEIVGAVEAGTNVDDALDALALEIETAMNADETLGGTCGDSLLVATEMGVDPDANKPIGMIKLTYEVTYYTYVVTADELDIFETAQVRHKLNNTIHVDNEAVDDLEDINQDEDP